MTKTDGITRIVIASGPSRGKSTLCNGLRKEGFAILTETARPQITYQQSRLAPILPWEKLQEFQEIVTARQIYREARFTRALGYLNQRVAIFDRGLADIAGYYTAGGLPVSEDIRRLAPHRYDVVFILDKIPGAYVNDAVRKESEAQGDHIHNHIHQAYVDVGYTPIIVPDLGINERVQFVLEHLNRLHISPSPAFDWSSVNLLAESQFSKAYVGGKK